MKINNTLCAWFIPEKISAQASLESNAAYILVNIIFIDLILTAIATVGLLFYLGSLNDRNLMTAICMLIFVAVGFSCSLFLFKAYGSFILSGNLVAFSCFCPLTASLMLTGGYHTSPLLIIFTIVPIFAFLLSGLVSGVIWASIITLTQLMFYLFSTYDFHGWQWLSENELFIFNSITPIFTTLIFTSSLIIYESTNRALRSKLFIERKKFYYQSRTDELTQIPNRKEFVWQLQRSVNKSKRLQHKLAILYIDLDNFKPINDTQGHHAGDLVLQTVAIRLKNQLRNTDTVARLGGDEFAIIVEDIHTKEDTLKLAQKVIASVAVPIDFNHTTLQVYASVGIATFPENSTDINELCIQADKAMYNAKKHHNTYHFSKGEI